MSRNTVEVVRDAVAHSQTMEGHAEENLYSQLVIEVVSEARYPAAEITHVDVSPNDADTP